MFRVTPDLQLLPLLSGIVSCSASTLDLQYHVPDLQLRKMPTKIAHHHAPHYTGSPSSTAPRMHISHSLSPFAFESEKQESIDIFDSVVPFSPKTATINSIAPQNFLPLSTTLVRSLSEELDVIPLQSNDCTDHQDGVVSSLESEDEGEDVLNQVVASGFGNNEGRLSFEGAAGFSSVISSSNSGEEEALNKLIDRAINATIVGSFAITKLVTIDHEYWHALFPFQDCWVVPGKVAFDQTV